MPLMEIDIGQYIGAVNRQVASRDLDGKPVRVTTSTRTYPTTPEDLWDAVTSAERIPRWFMPISGDLRLGGRYQLEGNAGGEILVCDPPRHLRITWEFGGQVSWVEVRIDAHESGARLALEHASPVDDGSWKQFGPGAAGVGWDLAIVGLTQHVSGGVIAGPDAGMKWMMSENGLQYVRASSEAWGRAWIESGIDAADAPAAIARTTAFYTGS